MCLTLVVLIVVEVHLTVPVICLVVDVEVASVTVVDRHSALFRHASWLSASVTNMCRTLSFCSFSSLLVVVVPFAFPFVTVSFSFAVSLLSFERSSLSNRLLIVFAFSSFLVVVAVVVPVAPVEFAFLALSFGLVLAFLSFALVLPCCSYVHRCRSLVVAAWCDACSLVNVAVAL